jgi:hypothetical protein
VPVGGKAPDEAFFCIRRTKRVKCSYEVAIHSTGATVVCGNSPKVPQYLMALTDRNASKPLTTTSWHDSGDWVN